MNALKAQINNLEKKVADIEKMLMAPSTELPKTEKEVIREVIREEQGKFDKFISPDEGLFERNM